MSGEGLSVSFRRTSMTAKPNDELLAEFQNLVYSNKKIMSHMKWYGKAHSLDILEHGDDNRQKFEQEYVAIKDTFQFEISVYESWYEDADVYESHERKDSFVSLAKEFAQNNNIMYFPEGYPAEWIEQEIIDGEKKWNHYNVKPDDKNIDKICEIYCDYSMKGINQAQGEKELWYKARDVIKQLMDKKEYAN